MNAILGCLLLPLLFSFVLSDSSNEPSLVIPLSDTNFTKVLSEDLENPALVEYYANWCGFCTKLSPELDHAASEVSRYGLKIYKVNCEDSPATCEQYKIQGYPTMHVLKNLTVIHECRDRTGVKIANFLRRSALSESARVDGENWKNFVTRKDLAFLGVFKDTQHPFYAIFQNFSNQHLLTLDCAILVDKNIPKELGSTIQPPFVLVFREDERDTEELRATDETTLLNLKTFAFVQNVPVLGSISYDNYDQYMDVGLPMMYIFVRDQQDRDSLLPDLAELAKKYRYQLTIGFIDASLFKTHAPVLGLTDDKFPSVAIHDLATDRKYPEPNRNDPLTVSSIESHVKSFLANEAQPFFLSEPLPETNDGPVKKVVHDNFVSMIMDETKDAVVFFTADGCNTCKRVAPLYDQLGESFIHEPEKIVIAKMKMDHNDMPASINITLTKLPSFYLFPAGRKTPISYEHHFSTEEFQKFIYENGGNKVEPVKVEGVKEHVDL